VRSQTGNEINREIMTSSQIQSNAAIQFIAKCCRAHVLTEKLLLAPNLRVGNQWREGVAWSGTGTVNLQSCTVRSIVVRLAQPWLLENDLGLASSAICQLLIHKSIIGLNDKGKLQYFGDVQAKDKLARLMARSVIDMRMAGLQSEKIDRSRFESSAKAKDIVAVARQYEAELTNLRLTDYTDCLQFVIGQLKGKLFDDETEFRCILASSLDLSPLERQFLQQLKRLGILLSPSKANSSDECGFLEGEDDGRKNLELVKQRRESNDLTIRVRVARGEVNEVRRALQDTLADGGPLDQIEILHTDYLTYVPLIHELLIGLQLQGEKSKSGTTVPLDSVDSIPVTFAEGIGCIYSRTGRALRSWVRWLRHDCLQSSLVQMFREGLLYVRDSEAVRGYSYLASTLQKLSIGLHRERYLPKIDDALQIAKQSQLETKENEATEENEATKENAATEEKGEPKENEATKEKGEKSDGHRSDYGHGALTALRNTIQPVIENAPALDARPLDVLQAAIRFLKYDARRESMLDKYAGKKLIEDIEAFCSSLEVYPELDINVWEWLEELPLESRVMASGPRPGKIHVDSITRGGHSGRAKTWVLGLDDTRFPPRGGQDPLILDRERSRLSADLTTSDAKSKRVVDQFHRTLAGCSDTLTLSFSDRSLAEDAEQFASAALIDLIRELDCDGSELSEEELSSNSTTFSDWNLPMLTVDDWWYQKQTAELDAAQRVKLLEEHHEHFGDRRAAVEAISSPEFGEFDGLVPAAGLKLDPTLEEARRISASRLETFGTCPRRFFFRYGLGINAPDELVIDLDRWLTPMAFGTLVHGVFEHFLRELTAENLVPEFDRDLPRLRKLLHKSIAQYRVHYPIPNEDAYQRQVHELERTIEIYLREDELYCRETGARPWVLEASLGVGGDLPETEVSCESPIHVPLSDGRVLKMGGLIDRIDRVDVGGSTFCNIWDYKSGSDYAFSQESPFQQGRKLQPFLYVGMLRHRLSATTGGEIEVRQFGYFFPNPRANKVHLQWTRGELKTGDEILRRICDLISAGCFVATDNADDCKFCDYLQICGDPRRVAANTMSMVADSSNEVLRPFGKLRQYDESGW
jgi:ATP-dependent helicase/nuclease subunit B